MVEKSENKFNLFKTITSVLKKTKVPEEDINKIPPFIFKRWLSNHPSGVMYANLFNLYKDVPIFHQYNFIKSTLQGKVKYIEYQKKMKDNSEGIEALQRYYNISSTVARTYYEMMGPERVQSIIDKYNKIGLKG